MDVNRQISWRAEGPCKHRALEEVRSANGKVLYGERCPACHAQWGIGRCDGCLATYRRLTIATAVGLRYCDKDCQELHDRRRAKEARAAKKERAAIAEDNGVPLVCDHRRTEDVFSEGGELIGVRCLGCLRPLPAAARHGGTR